MHPSGWGGCARQWQGLSMQVSVVCLPQTGCCLLLWASGAPFSVLADLTGKGVSPDTFPFSIPSQGHRSHPASSCFYVLLAYLVAWSFLFFQVFEIFCWCLGVLWELFHLQMYLVVLGLQCCAGFSLVAVSGYYSSYSAWASHWRDFSSCRAETLGVWTLAVVACGLSSCVLWL